MSPAAAVATAADVSATVVGGVEVVVAAAVSSSVVVHAVAATVADVFEVAAVVDVIFYLFFIYFSPIARSFAPSTPRIAWASAARRGTATSTRRSSSGTR